MMRRTRQVFLLCAAVALFWQLLVPPVVGTANNGDFPKVIGLFNMAAVPDDVYRYTPTRYEFSQKHHYWGGFYSSELLLVPPALALNRIFSKDGYFDLRFMGLIHAALFLAALYLFVPLVEDAAPALRICALTLVLLFFSDVMYVGYLNSFYMDAGALLFLMLSVVLFLRVLRWHMRRDAVLLAVCTLLLVTTKAPHALLGLWIAVLLFATRRRLWPKSGRAFAAVASILAVVSVLALWKSAPPEYSTRGCFTVVFYRILPRSHNVSATLSDLGLDDSWRPYIGRHSYSQGIDLSQPAFLQAVRSRISYSTLARFFVTHPRQAWDTLCASLGEAGLQRPALGNFDRGAGVPVSESRAFALWSDLKSRLFLDRNGWFLTSIAGLTAALAVLLLMIRKTLPAGGLAGGFALIGMALTELGVSSFGDAIEVARHHLLFYALYDMLLIAAVYLATRALARPPARNRGALMAEAAASRP
jgi:hypothetical protein